MKIKICECCNKQYKIKNYRYFISRFCSIKCRSKVVMGCYKYWDGKKRDKATIKKIKESWDSNRKIKYSILMSGKNNHNYGKPAWNSNKRCEQLAGKNNGCWKGNKASYVAKHIWIRKYYGKANKCENKECSYLNPKRYEWSNIDHEYKRIRSDWRMLCPSCHRKYDRSL